MTPPPLPLRRPAPPSFRGWGARLAALLLLLPTAARALDTGEWALRQTFTLESAGLVKFSLSPATLDHARPDLADLRMLDAAGREVPYALVRPGEVQPRPVSPRQFHADLTTDATVLTIETGTTEPLLTVTVATPGTAFVKPVRIERSDDGRAWEPVADGVPVFRQNGAAGLTLDLGQRPAAFLRLTVDDRRSPPVPFTGAVLLAGAAAEAPVEPVAVNITARDELPGETVLTLDLGAAHLPLASLTFVADDPWFTRNLTVAARELRDDTVVERPLTNGTIYRIAVDGLTPAARLVVPTGPGPMPRELIVHIDNGDSPPLAVTTVRGARHPIWLVFNAAAPGTFTLLLGQTHAAAPRYDLPAPAIAYTAIPLTPAALSPPAANPGYHPPEALANLALDGAPFEPKGWLWRKPVVLTSPGAQQLELDLDVLAQARSDLADLRLLVEGRQIPYLVEHTTLARPVPLVPVPANDPTSPRLSRWQLKLPRAGLPLTHLTLTSPTLLFQRHVRLYEIRSDDRGAAFEVTLAAADWQHTPGQPGAALRFTLSDRPQTDALWLQTDNGDNPPLVLAGAQAWNPVVRLLFKAAPDRTPALYYGETETAAPRYDLSLVANQLFNAEKSAARLGPAEALGPTAWSGGFSTSLGGPFFWCALVLVVALLLWTVARLLPKPPAG